MTTRRKMKADKERARKIKRAQDLINQGLTYQKIAGRIQVSKKTIDSWVKAGHLIPFRAQLAQLQKAVEESIIPDPEIHEGAPAPGTPGETAVAVEEPGHTVGDYEIPALDLPEDLAANILYKRFSKNGQLDKKMVRAVVITDIPYRNWDIVKVPLADVLKAGIYPARHGGGWIYPIIARRKNDGKWENWPRVSVTVRTSSQALYWFRHWPEWDSILSNLSEMWGKILTGGIIAVIILTLVVIFLLVFFGFIG